MAGNKVTGLRKRGYTVSKRNRYRTIQAALAGLGVPKAKVYCKPHPVVRQKRRLFWNKPECELLELYALARQLYREKMQECHPDLGGDAEEASRLNHCWDLVNRYYKSHRLL